MAMEVQTIVRRLLTDTDIAVKGFKNVNQKKKLPFDSSWSEAEFIKESITSAVLGGTETSGHYC